jgi:RimJ/RimL family protein N-acetyltransferase
MITLLNILTLEQKQKYCEIKTQSKFFHDNNIKNNKFKDYLPSCYLFYNDELIGGIRTYLKHNSFIEIEYCLDIKNQKVGHIKILFEYFLNLCLKNNIKRIIAHVAIANFKSLGFLIKNNFQILSLVDNIYCLERII